MSECCKAPNLVSFRGKVWKYSDAKVLSELKRAWSSYLPGDPGLDKMLRGEWVLQDWSSFRAIITREARKRGLKIPSDLRKTMGKWGVVL